MHPALQPTLDQPLVELLRASRIIGGIHSGSAWYASQLAQRIQATGKPLTDTTVGELLQLDRQIQAEISRTMGRRHA